MNLGVWRMNDFMQSMCNVFVEVYAYIYIWARFMVLYLIHYFSGGPEKHARPYIYIVYNNENIVYLIKLKT